VRNAGGYGILVDPDLGTVECDTFTCVHCQRVVEVKPKADPADMGGFCRLCDKPICPGCVGKACLPFERSIERAEARAAARRSYGF
jgi:hypothetical protein